MKRKILVYILLLVALGVSIIAPLSCSGQVTELALPYQVKLINPKPIDFYYYNTSGAPYTNTAQVISQVTSAARYQGQTFNVAGVEYWFGAGIADGDLAIKSSGPIAGSNTQVQFNNSGILGASSSFIWDGTQVTIGGISSNPHTSYGASGITQTSGGSGALQILSNDDDISIFPGPGKNVILPVIPTNDNTQSKILVRRTSDGRIETRDVSSITTLPAGSNTQIQFNNSSSFGASDKLIFDGNQLNLNDGTIANLSISNKGGGFSLINGPIAGRQGGSSTSGGEVDIFGGGGYSSQNGDIILTPGSGGGGIDGRIKLNGVTNDNTKTRIIVQDAGNNFLYYRNVSSLGTNLGAPVVINSNTTLSAGTVVYYVNTSGVTITMPSSPVAGDTYYIFNATAGSNTISSSLGFSQGGSGHLAGPIATNISYMFVYNGTDWMVK